MEKQSLDVSDTVLFTIYLKISMHLLDRVSHTFVEHPYGFFLFKSSFS